MLCKLNIDEILLKYQHLIKGDTVIYLGRSYYFNNFVDNVMAEFLHLTLEQRLPPEMAYEICQREIHRQTLIHNLSS